MLARAALTLSVLPIAAACSSPCRDLRNRAEACGAAVGRWEDEEASVCAATREELGEHFDELATCVERAACSDTEALERCEAAHVPAAADDPCLHYRLWASTCGLEPAGTADDCKSARDSATFAPWVACVTAGGCPVRDDQRFDRCGDTYVPDEATALFDACLLIEQWTGRCAGHSDVLPVEETPVPVCLAQAEPFTAASYLEYARCTSQLDCNAVSGRIDCLLRLAPTDRSRLRDECAALAAFAESCGSLLAGGSVDACTRLYARFTPESVAAFGRCVESYPCGDAEAEVECGVLLELG